MGVIKIERVGGFVGYGSPSLKMKSEGEQDLSALPEKDQAAVEALFEKRATAPDSPVPRFRLTRTMDGKHQTIEVPESAVPQSLQKCVTDKLL